MSAHSSTKVVIVWGCGGLLQPITVEGDRGPQASAVLGACERELDKYTRQRMREGGGGMVGALHIQTVTLTPR